MKAIETRLLQLRVNHGSQTINGVQVEPFVELDLNWYYEHKGKYYTLFYLITMIPRWIKRMVHNFDTFLSKTEWYESSRIRHQRDI